MARGGPAGGLAGSAGSLRSIPRPPRSIPHPPCTIPRSPGPANDAHVPRTPRQASVRLCRAPSANRSGTSATSQPDVGCSISHPSQYSILQFQVVQKFHPPHLFIPEIFPGNPPITEEIRVFRAIVFPRRHKPFKTNQILREFACEVPKLPEKSSDGALCVK